MVLTLHPYKPLYLLHPLILFHLNLFYIPVYEQYTFLDLDDMSELPFETINSEAIPSQLECAIIIYEQPFPKTLEECINMFKSKVNNIVAMLQDKACTNFKLQDLKNSWKVFQKWMS